MDHSLPCPGKGSCVTQWSYEPYHSRQVIVESSDNTWTIGGENGKLLNMPWEPHKQYKKAKKDTKEEPPPPRLEAVQYTTREEWKVLLIVPERTKWLGQIRSECTVADISGGESKIRCCKEQYCVVICNVRFMNKSKWDVVKQEMVRVNIDILGFSELKWMGMG